MLRPAHSPIFACAVVALSLAALFSCTSGPQTIEESRQATGVKVGEVTPTSAIVWMRVTENQSRRSEGIVRRGRAEHDNPETLEPRDLEGSAPGAPGRVRVRYGTSEDLSGASDTGWHDADPESDLTHHFRLDGLTPDMFITTPRKRRAPTVR